jgi:hypothetical protein
MLALARVWTLVGTTFIPFAGGWVVFIRNGLADAPPPIGVLVSRGYWGVLVTLLAGAALFWTMALYVRLARQKNALILAPPNTLFEDESNRNSLISWGTVIAFISAILIALTFFLVRYSESQLHKWDSQQAIERSFFGSRIEAHNIECLRQPCFALEQRFDASNKPIFGVNEYILFITDGVLVFLLFLMLAGAAFLVWGLYSRPRPVKFEL